MPNTNGFALRSCWVTAGLDKEKALDLAMELKRHGLNSRRVQFVAHARLQPLDPSRTGAKA
jgi:hypothetical protein